MALPTKPVDELEPARLARRARRIIHREAVIAAGFRRIGHALSAKYDHLG
jgi:hypothetical protein